MAEMINYEYIRRGFKILHPLMANYIGRELLRVYQTNWWNEVLEALGEKGQDLPVSGDNMTLIRSLDLANCLRLIDRRWHDVFATKLSIDYRTWAKELMGVRNTVAHIGQTDVDQEYAERALDTMALLCQAFDADDAEGTEQIRTFYRILRYGSADGSMASSTTLSTGTPSKNRQSAGVLEKNIIADGQSLPSWRDVMQPHPDVAQGRYQTAEFAADLAQVSRGEGAVEYRDPVEFFNRTYITEGMSGLLVKSLQRIAGLGGEPVIQLKTAFGGGKTHSMLALYHMVKGGVTVDRIPSLKPILERAGLSEFPRANVAVLVGTAMNPSKKKNPTNLPGYTVNTIWGEMAYQLVTAKGDPSLYKIIRESDLKGISPGSETLKNLFDACGPCVILMDELVAYARKINKSDDNRGVLYDNFITFIQEITEAARASKNSIVVASIPESNIEIGGEAGQLALEAIEHTFGRMESIWKPVAADEGFEVVRRRLFLDCRNEAQREQVCRAFSRMYQDNAADFPMETKEFPYLQRMISCYPIHPEVFDRLYDDWATLERFQRTRGVLRLMAAVIHELWMANDSSAMIMPGSIPLDMPDVRDELVRHLPDNWNSIIDHEVDGKNSVPYQTDQVRPRYGKILAARRVARTIMLGSAPTSRDQAVRGLEMAQIHLGTIQPGESIADFNDALNTLRDKLSYLYSNSNGNRFWFDTRPTLRKTASDRALQLDDDEVYAEIEKRLRKLRKEAPFSGVHICPSSTMDVPDEQTARLIILKPTQYYDPALQGIEASSAEEMAQEILAYRGTAPRVYKNMLAFVAADKRQLEGLCKDVRQFLAWTSIDADTEDLNLDANQTKETRNNLKRSEAMVDMHVKETYRWLLVPYIDQVESLRDMKWENENLGGGTENIVTKVANRMKQNEYIIDKWAPALLQMVLDEILWKDRDDIPVKELWEDLSRYCYLPRLANFSVLEAAICAGANSEEFFAIAASKKEDYYVGLQFNQSIYNVNTSDILVKPAIAKAQIEKEQPVEPKPVPPAPPVKPTPPSGGEVVPSGGGNIVPPVKPTPPTSQPHHFYMNADLDDTRIIKDVNKYVEEIIQPLQDLAGVKIELKLIVEVNAPDGIPSDTMRTVGENCSTLKIKDFEFND